MTQELALELLKTGRNVFLTGQAGSGKTYVINQYIDYLHKHKIAAAITASTGIAATHIGGSTIHSWSGMGIKDSLSPSQMATLKTRRYIKKRYKDVKVLILDEISMLHRKQFELLDELLKYMKDEPFKPFGGIQIVLSGDFLQLPPVSKENEPMKYRYCFMSPHWVNAEFLICYLHSQYRQEKNQLTEILNEIRNQDFTETTYTLLREKIENFKESESIERTRLYTHNADVDRMNDQFLNSLSTKEKTYKAITDGKKAILEKFETYSLLPFELTVKLGARVMFIKNDLEGEYMNGTVGKIVQFSKEGFPVVETDHKKKIEAKRVTWAIEDEKGTVLAKIEQVPLRLAWAVTVHKSQGMTLNSAEIDLSQTFEPGQGYVALSRLRDLEGMQLKGINNRALELDRLAFKADQRFIELSRDAETAFTKSEIKADQKSFILLAEGSLKAGESGKKKLSTYEKTKQLIEEDFDLKEIAEHRNLTPGTVIKHIVRLAKEDPKMNVDQLRPSQHIISLINSALDQCYPTKESKKDFSRKTIYEHLNGEFDYDTIQLAMLFIERENF